MSRRDTIIISVLVNAALLAVLFITAVTSKNKVQEEPKVATSTLLEETTIDAKELFSSNVENKEVVPLKDAVPSEVQKEFLALVESEKSAKPDEDKVVYKLPEVAVNIEEKNQEVLLTSVVEKPQPKNITVTVKKGDTLGKIAKNNKVRVSDLMKANNLTSSSLKIGQQLVIPKKQKVEKAVVTAQKTDTIVKDQPEYYTLKVGDNPYTVAIKHNLKLTDILKINGLDEKRARKLKPGDKIRIR